MKRDDSNWLDFDENALHRFHWPHLLQMEIQTHKLSSLIIV